MRAWFALLQDGLALATAARNDPTEVVRQSAVAVGTSVAIFTVYAWVIWFASIAGARYVVGECLSQKPSPAGSIRYAFTRLGTATRSLFLLALISAVACLVLGTAMSVALFVGMMLSSKGLIVFFGTMVGFFAFAVGFLWFLLLFLLIAPVLAMEELGAMASIKRSGQLMTGRIGPGVMSAVKVRATVLITAMMLVVLVGTSLGSIPSVFLTLAYAKRPA